MNYIIGIDLGGTYIKIGLVNSEGSIITRKKLVTPVSGGYRAVINLIIKNLPFPKNAQCRGIGFGVPGFVNARKGLVYRLVNIRGWDNVPLKKIMEKQTGIRACIDNDVNCMVMGEAAFGAAKGKQNVFGITLGTGVGGGIIINGRIYRGAGFTAGEIGHITVAKNGPRCNCGNRGCLEAFVGNNRIIARYKRRTGIKGTITAKDIQKAAQKGDKYARRIWQEAGEYIGIALAGIINVLNPEIIVIGGGVSGAGHFLMDSIRKTVEERALPIASSGTEIKKAKLGNDAGIIGSAALCLE